MPKIIIIKDKNGDIGEFDKDLLDDIDADQYLSAEDITCHVILTVDAVNLRFIRDMKKDDLIGLHMSIGLWIRNTFGLWQEDYPWTNEGKIDNTEHPDNYSFSIIEAIWDTLQHDKSILPPPTSEPFVVQ